jgi:glycerate kinase
VPLEILIMPDKFKGTLKARAAAQAIARGWRGARARDTLKLLPMSDGGDGFGEVMSDLLGAKVQRVRTVDAARRTSRAEWWWEPRSKTAIIESARVIGLAMLPPEKFHPFDLDTFGLGAVIRAAAAKGARHCIVGIGGSSTNDGGFGLARALGWEFLDREGKSIRQWTALHTLNRLEPPKRRRWFGDLTVAVDVKNPLLGAHGATRIYGPQKGLRPGDFELAESCLRRLSGVFRKQFGRDLKRISGAGAAGGLGFGLQAFLGARAEPGFDLFARLAKLPARLRSADVVIAGEGCIDRSSVMGKGAGEIARRCRRSKTPCLGMAGTIADHTRVDPFFTQIRALTDLTSVAGAQLKPAFWLEQLSRQMAVSWTSMESKIQNNRRAMAGTRRLPI